MRASLTLPIVLILAMGTGELAAQPPIGEWRDHFQYKRTMAVVAGGSDIYCATTTAVFKYNEQLGEMERYTKANALNDVNVQALGWNEATGTLVVGYRNGNLDLIHGGNTVNMPDIKRSSMLGDKGIYHIHSRGDLVYLGCGFGIVVVDLRRKEVKDTWLIGPNATSLRVNSIAFHADSIYAATETGLYSAWQHSPNLAAYANWHKRPDVPGANGKFTEVHSFGGKLLINRRVGNNEYEGRDTIYYEDAGWHVHTGALNRYVYHIRITSGGQRMVVSAPYDVMEYDTDLNPTYYAADLNGVGAIRPRDAIRADGSDGLWIASAEHGLVHFWGPDNFTINHPNGPDNNTVYRMASGKGAVYATTGGVAGNWTNLYRKDGVHSLIDGRWQSANMFNDPLFLSGNNNYGGALNDPMGVVVDPDDPAHAFVSSWDDGILEMRNGRGTGFFGPGNSTLQRSQNNEADNVPTYVGALAFDERGNLWVSNSNCNKPISVRLRNGNWYSFGFSSVLGTETLLSDIIAARNGLKWVVRPRGLGLLVFSDNGTPSQPSDDQAKVLTTFEGEGNLPSMDVFSVAEDLDGQIWVGTGKGIAVFYNPDLVFTNQNFDAQQILIEQDGNVQILLETEAVSVILVDGANRKWVGTETSGVFLLSADGTEQLAHFTQANSPLPSDNIICLTMEGSTGELFIGTDMGIVSYRGDAIAGVTKADCATVFPNPVRENFTGPVAITGLVRGSDVRITDVAGNLVYHTISKGGQAIWPITDMHGQRVSTGVYMVLALGPDGKNKCNTKVAVVR